MQLHLHQTHHQVGDFTGIFNYLDQYFATWPATTEGLHVFPELFLTGYPLQDLCLQKNFIEEYYELIDKINQWSLNQTTPDFPVALLIGGLNYEFDQQGLPLKIKNSIYVLEPGKKLECLYHKILLPNYDIFDELKYFTPGEEAVIWNWNHKNFGLMICEDMWPSSSHASNPTLMLADKEQPMDVVINLSASPYYLGKLEARVKRAEEISKFLNCPLVYVNRVGGEDEILFDGASFIQQASKTLLQAESFKSDVLSYQIEDSQTQIHALATGKIENTWENLFNVSYDKTQSPPTLKRLTDRDYDQIIEAICFGLQEYARKTGFKKFTIGLSGGIDSALALALCKISLKEAQTVEAVFLPGLYSSGLSYDLAREAAKRMSVPFHSMPIKFFHSSIRNAYRESFSENLEGLADENIQSRLRGSLLYARSNSQNSLVLNTSNKSEIAVGYSTLYGDSVGAISLLGDLYKTEVFELSRYINKKYGEVIPVGIIEREPSAELKENQIDSQSLPPYEVLDAILEGFLSYRLSKKDLHNLGFSVSEIDKVYGLYRKSEYKRSQFCPIIKLRAKSFGFGYRVPISKFVGN